MIIVGRLLCPCDKLVIIVDVVRVIGMCDDDVCVAAVVTVAVAASIIGNNFSVGIVMFFFLTLV